MKTCKKVISLLLSLMLAIGALAVGETAATAETDGNGEDETAIVRLYDLVGELCTEREFRVGDTFTVYAILNAADIQGGYIGQLKGEQAYTSSVLENIDEKNVKASGTTFKYINEVFPITKEKTSANAGIAGRIPYNASTPDYDVDAFNFNTDESILMATKFKVIAAGEAEVRNSMRTLSVADFDLTRIIDKGQIVNDNFSFIASFGTSDHNWDTEWSYNENGHYHKCLDDGCDAKKDEGEHSGGEATGQSGPICKICNKEYGNPLTVNYPLWVGGNQVTTGNMGALEDLDGITVADGGSVTFEPNNDGTGGTLYLNNATITGTKEYNTATSSTYSSNILVEVTDFDLTISITGENTINGGNAYHGIWVPNRNSNTVITGEGALDVTGVEYGIRCYNNLTIENTTVNATSSKNANGGNGIESHYINIKGSTVKAEAFDAYGYGIYANASLKIADSTVEATGEYTGICADDDFNYEGLTVSGISAVTAEGGSQLSAIFSKGGYHFEDGNDIVTPENHKYGTHGKGTIILNSDDSKATKVVIGQPCTVTFNDYNGNELQSGKILRGTAPEYKGETPVRTDESGQYTYTFSGWKDDAGNTYGAKQELPKVNGDITYTATFSSDLTKYTIQFVNADDSPLQTEELAWGATPEYRGATPTIPDTNEYKYTFAGWTPGISSVTGDATYKATYNETPVDYTVRYYVNGELYKEFTVPYGEEIPVPDDPQKDYYTFPGWGADIPATMPAYDLNYSAYFEAIRYPVWIGYAQIDGRNKDVLVQAETADGRNNGITVSEDGYALFEPDKDGKGGTLYLRNTTVTGGHEFTDGTSQRTANIYVEDGDYNLKINVSGYNELSGADIGIMTAQGNSVLTVTGDYYMGNSLMVHSKGDAVRCNNLLMTGASLFTDTAGSENGPDYGVHADSISLTGGAVSVSTKSEKCSALSCVPSLGENMPAAASFSATISGMILYNAEDNDSYKFFSTAIVAVKFVDDDGSTVLKETAIYSAINEYTVDKPDIPVKTDPAGLYVYTFAGWDDGNGRVYAREDTIREISGYTTFTATYTKAPAEYTVKYLVEGEVYKEYTAHPGEAVTVPDEPAKKYYTFAGWDSGIPGTMPAKDLTFNAVFEPVEYTATFIADGKTVKEEKFTFETEKLAEPDVPAKDGYEGKWSEYKLAASDIEINAVYTPVEFTATFIADSKTVKEIKYTVETKSIEAPAVPEKEGYTGEWEDYKLAVGGITVNAVYTENENPEPADLCPLDEKDHGDSFFGKLVKFIHTVIWKLFRLFGMNIYFRVG